MRSAMEYVFLLVIGFAAAELEWKFTKFPEPVTAPVGDEVTFECAVNVPGERLAWRWRPDRPGETWIDADGSSDRDKITTRLLVNIKDGAENALYQCVVWYGAISLASDPARLTIARIDLSRNNGETRVITAPLHNTVVLHCKEPISEPPAELTWWKEVQGVRQPVETPHGVLIIHNATTADSGTYGCTATNNLSDEHVELPERTYLRVQHEGNGGFRFLESEDYVGEVTDGILTVPVRPNGALRLWCGAVGTPLPQVTWYRGTEKRNGFRHDHDLVVHPFTAEDEGIYSCSVNGNALRRSWRVLALQPPYWEGVAYGVNASEGTPARVACGTPLGQPPPQVHWMLNAEPVTGKGIKAQGSELRFARVEKKHAGALQCFACNALGCAHDAALLTVVPVQISQEYSADSAKAAHIAYQQPKNKHNNRKNPKKKAKMVPPSRPTVTRMSDESVMVSWSNSSSGMPIRIFKVQYREVTNSSNGPWHTASSNIPPYIHSFEVDGLVPDRYYKFRIAAVYSNQDNTQGRSSPRFYLQRGGIEGPRAPDLIAAEPVSSSSVRLNWTWSSGGGVEAEGFYVYYRAVSSAGKYEKVTVEGGATRVAILGHLAADTAYEWKLQSYTAQAPSEFSKILVAKTLPNPTTPSSSTEPPPAPAAPEGRAPAALVTAGGAIGATALLVILVVTLLLCRRARRPPANKEKGSGPESGGANGYIPAKVPITITANPMHAESGDGGVEMSFLHNNNCGNTAGADDTLPRTRKNGSRQYV
ncbi:interference hedgehog [Cydia strobilella]|uniref:interference hedgehog n=1 Tax=Cydia strobilella TaxID=1100964 RepID=UPI003003BFD8